MASMDEEYGKDWKREYLGRKEQDANNMLASRFMPLMCDGQVRYQVQVVVADGLRSAATIGEVICGTAAKVEADILVIASHGTGLLADYGSVARYCTQHFQRALVLIPPGIDQLAQRNDDAICCGVNTVSELQGAASFVASDLIRPGDALHVLHAFEERLTPAGGNSDVEIAACAEQVSKDKGYEVRVQHLPAEVALAADDRNKRSAQQVLDAAMHSRSRALVLVNYASQGMLQEMMMGSLAMHCSRSAKLPLVLIPPSLF